MAQQRRPYEQYETEVVRKSRTFLWVIKGIDEILSRRNYKLPIMDFQMPGYFSPNNWRLQMGYRGEPCITVHTLPSSKPEQCESSAYYNMRAVILSQPGSSLTDYIFAERRVGADWEATPLTEKDNPSTNAFLLPESEILTRLTAEHKSVELKIDFEAIQSVQRNRMPETRTPFGYWLYIVNKYIEERETRMD